MGSKVKFEFEEFKKPSKSKADFPRATISTAGNINFNRKFLDEYFSDRAKRWHVAFHFDKKNKIIGLQIIPDPTQYSNPIRLLGSGSGKGLTVSARAFLKEYEIPYADKSRSYGIELFEKDDSSFFFIIKLNKSE